ncbi:MAG: GNAT family N-acetyltransferase [Negativicutes bacterium]|nr:GNAT family N-acetyltransferase [Negativicutes bacterium]
MEVRKPAGNDLSQMQDLWACCFEKKHEPFYQWFFSRRYRPENALGAFADGELLAALHVVPYSLFVRGAIVPAAYVMGVATYPAYRRKGLMAELLINSLAAMRRRGQWLSFLEPRVPSIYEKFGWSICYYVHQYAVPAAHLAGRPVPAGFRPAGAPQDIPRLDAIYRQYMQDKHGYIVREDADWERLISENDSEGGLLYICEDAGQPAAYLLFLPAQEGYLRIKELAYISPHERDKIFAFAASQPAAQRIGWRLPPGDLAYWRLADAKNSIMLNPFMAARIVDVPRLLENLHFPTGMTAAVALRIHDGHAPWNDGCFYVQIAGGRAQIEAAKHARAEMTVAGLTQLVIGALDIYGLIATGAAAAQPAEASLLAEIWPLQAPFITETF